MITQLALSGLSPVGVHASSPMVKMQFPEGALSDREASQIGASRSCTGTPIRSAQRNTPDPPPVPSSCAQPLSTVRYETRSRLSSVIKVMTQSTRAASRIQRDRLGLFR